MQDYRLLSAPVRVRWAGWTSDTASLQREGWQVESFYIAHSHEHQLAMYHPHWNLRGLSQRIPLPMHWQDPFDYRRQGEYEEIHFGMKAISEKIVIGQPFPMQPYGAFSPIDCEPQIVKTNLTSLDDLCHFAPRELTPSQQIILPEPTVDELLAKILEQQDPARQEYYRQQARNERLLKRVHAQIISLSDFKQAA